MRYAHITKRDFDRALKDNNGLWSSGTCLIAQTAKRLKLRGWMSVNTYNPVAAKLMNRFDDSADSIFSQIGSKTTTVSTKWNKPKLARIRKLLPVRIELPSGD